MNTDRLHVLDVSVSVKASPDIVSRVQSNTFQHIAICNKTHVIAIANGRVVDLYGVSANPEHPFTFLHQIALDDHVLRAPAWTNFSESDVKIVVATCVTFPVPGILLVGTSIKVYESENSESERIRNPILVLGFRLYAGSVTQDRSGTNKSKLRKLPVAIHVSFSFADVVIGANGKNIQTLHPFRQDMTPDTGAVVILFENSKLFGVLLWNQRLSDRQVCLARVKQQTKEVVSAACNQDGQSIVLGDAEGRLFLMDFRNFLLDERNVVYKLKQSAGKRLVLGPSSRSGVTVRDNPLEHVRLVHAVASSERDGAYTSLRWWSWNEQKHFVLAGQLDGSLHIFKLVRETEKANRFVHLKCIQMYPGLAPGTHDAVRGISTPIPCLRKNLKQVEFVVVSNMRWRVWQLNVTEYGAGSSKQYRLKCPSVRESLDFQSFPFQIQDAKSIILLPNSSEASKFIAKALATSSPNSASRYPVSLTISANRLQVVGLLTRAVAESDEVFAVSKSGASEEKGEGVDSTGERDEDTFGSPILKVKDDSDYDFSGPTTIQDKYKLPSMQWKARMSTRIGIDLEKEDRLKAHDLKGFSISKVSRVEQTERVNSVIQRVETLNSTLNSMRTSFQLFSADVQCHLKVVSDQLEELSCQLVTRETANRSTE